MSTDDAAHLAPITPIFGRTAQETAREDQPSAGEEQSPADGPDRGAPDGDPRFSVPRRTGADGVWRSTWDESAAASGAGDAGLSPRHPAASSRAHRPAPVRALRPSSHDHATESGEVTPEPEPDPDAVRAQAEERLVRKLRARALSVSEARGVLREQGLDSAACDLVIDDFSRRSYLDDRVLAGHLVTSGVQRKAQGRVALRRALSQRGIPRDVIDEALEALPDDDAERALDFARTKARSMARLEHETALRRLLGQLARRGFGGHVAMEAARTALREVQSGGSSSGGVRFEPS